jgi:hypothetical protein
MSNARVTVVFPFNTAAICRFIDTLHLSERAASPGSLWRCSVECVHTMVYLHRDKHSYCMSIKLRACYTARLLSRM